MIKLIEPSVEIVDAIDGAAILRKLERCGRTAWQSEGRITEDSAPRFVKMIVGKKHESVLEHVSVTVRMICDRSTSHQFVRHRLNANTQASQRYINYAKGGELLVICPPTIQESIEAHECWRPHVEATFSVYQKLVACGIPPEDARSVLSNCVATEIVTTANLRQWRLIFETRVDLHAQHQIRGLMSNLLRMFRDKIPVVFDDICEKFGMGL